VWGEGASDLWGRLEGDDDDGEAELREALRERLRGASAGGGEDDAVEPATPSREAA